MLRLRNRGGQFDTSLIASPWDVDPQLVSTPVTLWHGGLDADAPLEMGRWIAGSVPDCQANFLPGQGHIFLIVNHAQPVLGSLLAE